MAFFSFYLGGAFVAMYFIFHNDITQEFPEISYLFFGTIFILLGYWNGLGMLFTDSKKKKRDKWDKMLEGKPNI